MSTIPAKAFAAVTPGVQGAGGRAIDLVGLMLDNGTRVPIGVVQQFANPIDVSNYFGPASEQYALSLVYFAGYDDSFIKPALLLMAQYPQAAVSAYLRGGSVASLSLDEIKALPTSAVAVEIDGVMITAASVSLSGATSPSNAAQIIQAAFLATQATATSNTIAGTTLTLGGTITGTWAPGQTVVGTSVTPGTFIKSLIAGTPNTDGATYLLSASSTVSVGESMTGGVVPLVTYDSITGEFLFNTVLDGSTESIGFAGVNSLTTGLKLTQATGAVTSPGADAATPAAFMDGIVQDTTNFATFMTTFDPDVSGNDNKFAFAQWNGLQTDEFGYVAWDTDVSPSITVPASSSLGQRIEAAEISGTHIIGGDGTNPVTASYAAFVCSFGACLDTGRFNGRATLAFRQQSGLLATCSSQSAKDNLEANGYNFYGITANAANQWDFLYPGSISGDFAWMDSYVDQIWLNSQLQTAIMELFVNTPSIPYNNQGYSLIRAAVLDPINAAVNFGAIRAGITLSQAQIAAVNNAAGLVIDGVISQRGWYFQVQDASPQVRAARGSPPCTLFYTDGQSVQQINLFSEELV